MRCFVLCCTFLCLVSPWPAAVRAADHIDYLGLRGKDITSLGLWDGILVAGCRDDGVFWRPEGSPSDTSWSLVGLENEYVLAVYPHKSGPLGWAIGAGVDPAPGDNVFTYCSFMGEPFVPSSAGILTESTDAVAGLDGFPDPTVCGETFAAGTEAVYRRQFGCDTWVPVYQDSLADFVTVRAHNEYPGVVLAGGGWWDFGALLVRSTDFGDSWETYYPPGYLWDIDFIGASADTIFATALGEVYRSFNAGADWETILSSPPSGDWYIAVIVARERQQVYVGGEAEDGGTLLLCSDDWGDGWRRISTGLTGWVVDLQLNAEEQVIFAHQSDGVYRLDPDLVGVEGSGRFSAPLDLVLEQNVPNPFNPVTSIAFSLPDRGRVVVRLYDVRGRLVRDLADATMLAGRHLLNWDGNDSRGDAAPSGVYFVQLETETGVASRRMTLLR